MLDLNFSQLKGPRTVMDPGFEKLPLARLSKEPIAFGEKVFQIARICQQGLARKRSIATRKPFGTSLATVIVPTVLPTTIDVGCKVRKMEKLSCRPASQGLGGIQAKKPNP